MPVNELDSTRALITLEEARLFSLRSAADQSRDEILIDAINEVSDAIWDHCEREFLATATATARTFQVLPSGYVDLAPYEPRTVTQVKLYTDLDVGSHQVLTTDEYRLRPAGRTPEGTWLSLLVTAPAVAELHPGFGWEVTVTGDWGMTTTPPAVKLACKQWVDNIVKNPGSFATQQMNGFTVTPDVDFAPTAAGMPAAVRHRLHRYRRSI